MYLVVFVLNSMCLRREKLLKIVLLNELSLQSAGYVLALLFLGSVLVRFRLNLY